MKKVNKSLILLGALAAIVGGSCILQTETFINKTKQKPEIQAYNHNTSNILDNVFVENSTTYLPFIFADATETISVDKIKSEFNKAGLTVKNISTNNIGTGTKITVTQNNKVYNVLIYGDTNGDGKVNLIDAQKIILHKKNPTKNALTGIYFKAGNVSNNNTTLDLIDAQRVIMFKKGTLAKLVVIEPTSTKELDSVKPIIKLKGSSTVTIEVGSTYTDEGATATDNYDGTITNKIITINTVNTKKIGTYTVKYNVTDSNGNVANTVTRTVKVVDTTKPVIKLSGNSVVTINVKSTYTDEGATATDNYDGTITNKITKTIKFNGTTVSSIDTNKVGKYTIEYNLTDANKNKATTVIRTINVVDVIDTISMLSNPNKTEYNYGEEKIDLTDAKININWLSGAITNVAITENMLSSYDLSQEGEKTITVNYEGKQTTFSVTVLNKITAIELIETGRSNVTEIEGGYQTNSREQFVLGTIKEVQQENGSKLEDSQVKITTNLISSDDEATEQDLNMTVEKDDQGNILIKGTCEKAGNYTINIGIKYGEEEIKLDTIDLKVEKSTTVQDFTLETIADEEVRINKPAQKQLKITNVNGETIDAVADSIQITNVTEGITISKLDEEGKVSDDANAAIKYLKIETSTATEQKVSFTIQIGKVSKTVSFKIGEKLVLTDIQVYKNENEEVNKIELSAENENILLVDFLNQLNEKMNIKATDIITFNGTNTGSLHLEENQVAIIMPTAKGEITIGNIKETTDTNAIEATLYDASGNIASGDTNVSKIGFSILNDANIKVILSSLKDKEIEIIWKDQLSTYKLPIQVNYKTITALDMTETGRSNVTIDGEENNVVNLNEEFVLGTMEVGENEGPLTNDMLKTEINKQSGVTISYEKQENGTILIKGTATEEGLYEIKPYIEINSSKIYSKTVVILKVNKQAPEVTDVILTNTNLEIGKTLLTEFKAITTTNSEGEYVKLKDVNISEEEGITIEKLDEEMNPITSNQTDKTIKYLRITTNLQQDIEKNITFTFSEKNITKTISIYQPIIKSIEVNQTVQLYETDLTDDAVEVIESGKTRVYTLLQIKAYADAEKTKPITLDATMLETNLSGEDGKIHIKIPNISKSITIGDSSIPTEGAAVDIKYFNSNKEEATSGKVKYIGLAMPKQEDGAYSATDLNGQEITFTYTTDDTVTAKITTVYTEN